MHPIRSDVRALALGLALIAALAAAPGAAAAEVRYESVEIEGLSIAYREGGDPTAPTVLLLHGFPTSSHMFRNLLPALAGEYHVVAPDYPGYGNSDAPDIAEFDYTFDNVAHVMERFLEEKGIERYSLYLMDYGAPIGFRIATAHPERVETLIIQNGNAYEEGLSDFWIPLKAYWKDRSDAHADALRAFLKRDATKWQYTHGTRDASAISPDNWNVDQPLLDRPGNDAIQLAMFYSYGSNPPLYPQWQAYLRKQQPPTLIVWGKNDTIFPESGAHPYLRDLPKAELHLLDTGHFALEEDGETIARLMLEFLRRWVKSST